METSAQTIGRPVRSEVILNTMFRTANAIGLVCLVTLLSARVAVAQVGAGQITGIITDANDAPVPGATVTARRTTTGTARSVVSSSSGVYTLPALAPGEY